MDFNRSGLMLLCVLLPAMVIAPTASAQVGAPWGELHPDAEIVTAPVEVDGRVLFRVRGVTSFPAEARAAAIVARIESFASDPTAEAAVVQVTDSSTHSTISVGEKPLMTLFDADARVEQTEREDLAIANSERISAAIADYRRERTPEVLRKHAVEAAAALAALALVVTAVVWLTGRLHDLLAKRFRSRVGGLEIRSFEIVRAERIWAALRAAVSGLRFLAVAAAVFASLDFVLGGFPWTRAFARDLTTVVVRPLKTMGEAFVGYFPDLVFLVILALIVRFFLRLIRLFFGAVARGAVSLEDFEREWAWPTYKIVRFAVLTFAVIVAYPYIPGSDSDAFKGISLLVGLVVSLGSSSAIANLVAGLMITYRRAFKLGDRVMIGDVIGDVIDIHAQVTHLRTLKNEEVTIANSQILNGHVVNYSSLAAEKGLIVHSRVGIGYETPWRQVEALLLMAVARTPGLLAEPPPFVLYGELGDFCVSYEINAHCREAHAVPRLHAQLQRNILDVFNEYAVQIMTPNYEADTTVAKVVDRANWYAAPAEPEPAALSKESAQPSVGHHQRGIHENRC
ncbi:MAG: Potassium efflux system KefA precursor [Candidatus Accumulibacter appositus]|uniref:Small-conductance mechanosensitive channel n=2 Tax=Candidatus Accumulibacter TaxID=327159 RepID=A0A011NAS0_9PROT|nr:MAG: Potassium efflux system KefA precursor [Candidatus Accumulibacter appositus]